MTDPAIEAIEQTRLHAAEDLGQCIGVLCGTVNPLEVLAAIRSAAGIIAANPPSASAPDEYHAAYAVAVNIVGVIRARFP